MLVLTRNKGQKLLIGDDIVVKVNDVKGGQVQLAVKAPGNLKIDREEVRRSKSLEKCQNSRRR